MYIYVWLWRVYNPLRSWVLTATPLSQGKNMRGYRIIGGRGGGRNKEPWFRLLNNLLSWKTEVNVSTVSTVSNYSKEVSKQQEPWCFWTCLHYGLYLHISRLQGPVLLLGLSTQQRRVLHLDISTPNRPELHPILYRGLFFYSTWAWAAHGLVCTTGAFAAPHHTSLSCTYRGLCCTRTCLLPRVWAAPGFLELFGQQAPLLLLYVSTPNGPGLHL